jgi:hypothetical protein
VLPQLGVIQLEGRELGDLRLLLGLVSCRMSDLPLERKESAHTGLSAVYELAGAVDDMPALSVPPFLLPMSS